MKRPLVIGIAIAAILVAIGAPLAAALVMATRDAEEVELLHMAGHARDVLLRSEMTAAEITYGIDSLVALGSADPCSEESQALMRRIDLASGYIQAIGSVVGNSMVCSSLGSNLGELQLDLGPPDVVNANGVTIRTSVEFPGMGEASFIVVERDGFAAILHKELVLDTAARAQRVTMALFSKNGEVLASYGEIDPEWLARFDGQNDVAFVDDSHIVVIASSRTRPLVALAAEPKAALDQAAREAAQSIAPIGVVAALALTAGVLYLARLQLAFPALIKTALRRNEFSVVYQPIVELASGRWVGAEALIRWRRVGGEIVRPDHFIPIAEETGVIRRITSRLLALVASDAHGLFHDHRDFYISVNLSSADMHTDATVGLMDDLAAAVHAGRLNLMVEATEHSFTDAARAGPIVAALRERGIRIAIDDFGTGYSSLASLQTMRLDYLKIDKVFVDTVGTDAATSHVILHIIEMAKSLHLELVAEGVETEAQAAFLREHGVHYAQGYLFARPMPMADLVAGLDAAAVDRRVHGSTLA